MVYADVVNLCRSLQLRLLILAVALIASAACGDDEGDTRATGSCIQEITTFEFDEISNEQIICVDVTALTCEDLEFPARPVSIAAEGVRRSARTTFNARATCESDGYVIPCGTLGFVRQSTDC